MDFPFSIFKRIGPVGNYVYTAVKDFFHSGKILKIINHNFITSIPKIDSPSNHNHFISISLCSTIYKVISNIMANRLRLVIGKIVHPLQGALVPEKLIQDNILLAHEVFHTFKSKKGNQGWLAIKLDMEKLMID